MTLQDPTTYGEYVGNMRLQAYLEEQGIYEEEFSGLIGSFLADFEGIKDLPPSIAGVLNTLIKPKGKGLAPVGARFLSEVADGVVAPVLNSALRDFNYWLNAKFADLRIDPPVASALFMRGKITDELYQSRMASGGYKEAEANAYYDSLRPYPTVPEIMLWSRYHGDPENIREKVWSRFDVDVLDFDLWEWLTWQRFATDQVTTLYKRDKWDRYKADNKLAEIGWQKDQREDVLELSYQLPNAMLLAQGDLFQQIDFDTIRKDISKADIHPEYAQKYLDAILTKPPTQDIIAYGLRKDPRLPDLDKELSKIGIHPNYNDLYRELAYPIPPIADLITMAVREAFTPEIAQRFGQYEDFPPAFEEFATKKGLTREWALRYWAAHWALPSPQQGFEMLHRGVIKRPDLELLLRASDVMPFWRDKLIDIAYRPIGRIDIRRMYRVGVLDRRGVVDSYLKIGYNDENAERMTEFVIRQAKQTLSGFTATDVIAAYKNRLITDTELKRQLVDLGIRQDEVNYVIETATYQREWDYKKDQVSAIGNLFRKNKYDEDEARSELVKLQIPAKEIEILFNKWETKKKVELDATWTTAQTLSFLKKGLIDEGRARTEFSLLGYNSERVSILLKSIAAA